MFKRGVVKDVIVKDLPKFVDDRGWLTELFQEDEIDSRYLPVMSYVSMTHPGIARGPHDQVDLADNLAIRGPSDFKLILWDSRLTRMPSTSWNDL
jgi:dTDP-4-dehydrorhamnose 3,5-epimerase